jgi:hypothetical protein
MDEVSGCADGKRRGNRQLVLRLAKEVIEVGKKLEKKLEQKMVKIR